MAWVLNSYHCEDCDLRWSDEWFCGCDDECPRCREDHSPEDSEVILSDAEQLADYGAYNVGRWVAPQAWNYPSAEFTTQVTSQGANEDIDVFIDRLLNT